MHIIYNSEQRLHYPEGFLFRGIRKPNPEVPERIDVLLDAATAAGHTLKAPDDYGTAPLAALHTPEYLQFLQTIHDRWQQLEGAGDEVIPNVHPVHYAASYPEGAIGLAGYHMADTACPIAADTWSSALASCHSAVHAAQQVLAGEQTVYALCRPPGHHAYADMAGGFCYINNSAVAAQQLRSQYARVAILDVDVHHGNGTQGIFYQRNDILTISLHADPTNYYPFFWGYAHERGEGIGLGYNYNLPLAHGSDDDQYLQALPLALQRIQQFQPGALVVALGLDAFKGDPLASLAITTTGFARIAEAIGRLKLPTVLVQEGGYLCAELGANLASFLQGFTEGQNA